MSHRRSDILQNRRLSIDIVDDHIEASVAVEVADGDAARAPGLRECSARPGADSLESAVAQIMKQQSLLRVTGAPLMLVDRRIHMTIRHEEIFPTVVVIIDETCAPAEKRNCHLAHPGLERKIGKVSFAVVVIENI